MAKLCLIIFVSLSPLSTGNVTEYFLPHSIPTLSKVLIPANSSIFGPIINVLEPMGLHSRGVITVLHLFLRCL